MTAYTVYLCAASSSGLSPSPPKIPRLSIVMGAGSGGDAGQMTRSPGNSGDGDRLELGEAHNQTVHRIGCNLKHYNKMLMRPATDLHGYCCSMQ